MDNHALAYLIVDASIFVAGIVGFVIGGIGGFILGRKSKDGEWNEQSNARTNRG